MGSQWASICVFRDLTSIRSAWTCNTIQYITNDVLPIYVSYIGFQLGRLYLGVRARPLVNGALHVSYELPVRMLVVTALLLSASLRRSAEISLYLLSRVYNLPIITVLVTLVCYYCKFIIYIIVDMNLVCRLAYSL